MKWIFNLLLALWLAPLWLTPVLAQGGPGYPCQGCVEDRPLFTMPSSALWYALERPGTGLSITVQDGFLVGMYYGFTPTGSPLWYLFTGPLEQPEDAPSKMRVRANLQRVENGPCLGCGYQAPDFLPSPGEATLEFDQANHATFAIDDSEPLTMLPFIAGVGYARLLPSYTDYNFPDLNGTWVAVQEVPQADGNWRYDSHIGELRSSSKLDRYANWNLLESWTPLDQYVILGLYCAFNRGIPGVDDPHSHDVPDCWLSDIVDLPDRPLGERLYFPVPYANIGASRISAVHPQTGVRLTMYRLEYD